MDMTCGYAAALGEARSCLAALADIALTVDESIHYDRLLLRLDFVHQDYPGDHPVTATRQELLDRVEVAVEKMLELGGSGLSLELLLADAFDGPAS